MRKNSLKNKRQCIVYVSGPLTSSNSLQVKRNIEIAKQATIELLNRGFGVICPHLNSPIDLESSANYSDYLEMYLEIVKRCDIIFMLPNYLESNGATKERFVAGQNTIPITYTIDQVEGVYEERFCKRETVDVKKKYRYFISYAIHSYIFDDDKFFRDFIELDIEIRDLPDVIIVEEQLKGSNNVEVRLLSYQKIEEIA